MPTKRSPSVLFAAFLLSACQVDSQKIQDNAAWPHEISLPDVTLSFAPFDQVQVKWKQRLEVPYIYLENIGDYRKVGARIAELLTEAKRQATPIQGAPFVLFYDDPGMTDPAKLRARVCIAIDDGFDARSPLFLDELPATTVAYAAVVGPFSSVSEAYPGILAFMRQRGWQPVPPIREMYLVSPADHPASELVTEVQIPWIPGG